jgi:hypothetical protein
MSMASDYQHGRIVGRMAATGMMPALVPGPCWWLGYLSAWAEWQMQQWQRQISR